MMRVGALALFAAITSANPPAHGQAADCDGDRMSNAEYGICLDRVLRREDAALNRAFQAALAGIDGESHLTAEQRAHWKDALRRSQRAWIAFRDVDCGEMIGWEWHGGSGRGSAELACRVERTRARTGDFRRRYSVR